jgi:hypothetical protein
MGGMRIKRLLPVGAALAVTAIVGSLHLAAPPAPLAPIDPNEPGALAALAANVGLPFREPDMTAVRSPNDPRPFLLPNGALTQLGDGYRIDVQPEYGDDEALVFVDGDDLLFRIDPFVPDEATTVAEFPATVRERLLEGHTISWGYAPYRVAIWLVDPGPIRSAVATMRRDRRLSRQSNAVLDLLEVQLLIAHDLHTEAIRLAARLPEDAPTLLPASRALLAARQAAGYPHFGTISYIHRLEAERRARVMATTAFAGD